MGDFLSKANTEKHSENGEFPGIRFGACGMQGWRKRMEDSHIADLNIAKNTHLFGVFDGHGGREVALYVKKHFTKEFLNNKNYKQGNMKNALIESFLRIDTLVMDPKGVAELKEEAKRTKEDDEKQAPPIYIQSPNKVDTKSYSQSYYQRVTKPKNEAKK